MAMTEKRSSNKPMRLAGKGGKEHRKYQNLIREYFINLGKIALVEAYINGKNIDVFVQDIKTKKSIGVEIQLNKNPKLAFENIEKDFKAGCDEILLVFKKLTDLKTVKKSLFKKIGKEKIKRIQFCLIDDFTSDFIPKRHKNNTYNKAE